MAKKKKRGPGRPGIFETPEEMQKKIDLYFKNETGIELLRDENGEALKDKRGKPIYDVRPPTVAGLALYLGFCDRCQLYEQKARVGFSHTVKRAIARIEKFAERCLFLDAKPIGAIFWLKNHGWRDKFEVEHNVGDETLEKWKELSVDELIKLQRASAKALLAVPEGVSGDPRRN